MLETRTNIDGRYDRNRGQKNNINMSPQNFNLINPVYSQIDNFFSYKILDEDAYKNTYYPNQITWSKTKTNGADVDMWTNATLASILELDGDKGEVNELIRFNDQLLCFQDTGISQVLYNENVQISTTDGVPIEIANSGKVQGKRYLSNTIGCSNKWSMELTPAGVYFMDNNDKSIYRLGEGLQNISQQGGFNSWCKQNIPDMNTLWNPTFPKNSGLSSFTTFYDKMNQDVLFINRDTALAYSEKINAFTSFYDYGNSPFFCNLDDTGIWLRNDDSSTSLWRHQAGGYCDFFSTDNYDGHKPYWTILVGNPEPQLDKIFTNLEFRASIMGDGTSSEEKDTDGNPIKFTPSLPFDSLETWNEYQHGIAKLNVRNGHSAAVHHPKNSIDASLKRKFRIWRCDIPRDNVEAPEVDAERGISRYSRKPQDRMRNPWLYLKLTKDKAATGNLPKAEIHDVMMTYFT
jgi:hypothetical protein